MDRLNFFWLGAGGFLTLFCVNEIIAYHTMRVTLWLGGPLSYAGMVVGAVLGVSVMSFLGVEEPPEESPDEDDTDGEETREDAPAPDRSGPAGDASDRPRDKEQDEAPQTS